MFVGTELFAHNRCYVLYLKFVSFTTVLYLRSSLTIYHVHSTMNLFQYIFMSSLDPYVYTSKSLFISIKNHDLYINNYENLENIRERKMRQEKIIYAHSINDSVCPSIHFFEPK